MEVTATPASMRLINQRTLVRLFLRLGTASRADLAKAAGMSQPTAGKIANRLVEMGVLEEIDDEAAAAESSTNGNAKSNRLGRPGRLLRLDRTRPRFMAVQLGVKQTCLSPLPIAVQTDDNWSIDFPTAPTPEGWMAQLAKAAVALPTESLWGVLISVPGIVDESNGKVLFSPNLHWTERFDIVKSLQRVWPAPTLLVQEIHALALGQLAAEPACEDFLLVDFGQGVGGAVVLGGKLFQGALPLNGELGHTPSLGNTRPCGCGAVGCVETLLSRRGLLESFASACPGTTRSWETLAEHVREQGVAPWLAESLDAMGGIIAGALNALGLKRVIVTGSLTELPDCVVDHLRASLRRGAMWARFGEVICQSARRHRSAGLVAAGVDRILVPATHWEGGPRRHPRRSGAQTPTSHSNTPPHLARSRA